MNSMQIQANGMKTSRTKWLPFSYKEADIVDSFKKIMKTVLGKSLIAHYFLGTFIIFCHHICEILKALFIRCKQTCPPS